MIPGDIDLTENLDFRKVVKRKIPKFPDVWKKSEIYISNKQRISIDSTTSSGLQTYYYANNITDVRLSLIGGNNQYQFTYENQESNYINRINTTSSSISINSTYGYIYYTNDPNIKISITSGNEYKHDVFGNIKNNIVEEIPKIPWNKKYKYSYSIQKIPWNNKTYINFKEYDYSIPWDYTNDEPNCICDLTSKYDRAKKLISWLSNKSSSFINNYLKREDDDSTLSYLTNMSWIRVRDAIIE